MLAIRRRAGSWQNTEQVVNVKYPNKMTAAGKDAITFNISIRRRKLAAPGT